MGEHAIQYMILTFIIGGIFLTNILFWNTEYSANFFTMFIPLLILIIISASGLLLFVFKKNNHKILNLLISFGAGSMLSISLVHIFPETLEQTKFAIYAFIAGFLVIYCIEEILTSHVHDHEHNDHTHEDPHEHYDHVAIVSFIAIFIHTIFDGIGIRAGFGISSEMGYSILAGVAIHQIPVSLSLAAIIRESKFQKNIQIISILFFAFAAPIGYIVSDLILSNISSIFTGLATAFAGGSLLYVATADLLPVIHAQTSRKYVTVLLFIIGTVSMSAIKFFE